MRPEENIVIIPFKGSKIRGVKLMTSSGKEYYGFLGIPYAKPPLGDLRFAPPQSIESYPALIDATRNGDLCIQKQSGKDATIAPAIGSEDCLYLNVYIPELLKKNENLKAVLFNITSGGFNRVMQEYRNPDSIVENDVIFVAASFRLHALGFLNLGIPECPGNVGLKDVAEILKWIKTNIRYFGGDSENVTLYGTSSGATCVHLLAMSPLTKGLFNKAIISSGHGLSPWALVDNPVKHAFELGRSLGFEGSSRRELLDFLKNIPAEELLQAVYGLQNPKNLNKTEMLWSVYIFRPSVEDIKQGAFLPDTPQKLWKNVNLDAVISGFCEYEGSYFIRNKVSTNGYEERNFIKGYMKTFVDDYFQLNPEQSLKLYEEIVDFYLGDEETGSDVFPSFMKFCSDLMMRDYYCTFNFMRKPGIKNTFNYLFSCDGPLNIAKLQHRLRFPLSVKGAYHSDEYAYIMPGILEKSVEANEEDMLVSRNITKLWTNFVKTGNPNGKGIDYVWKQSSSEQPRYLRIDKTVKMVPGEIFENRVKFWRNVYKKYLRQTWKNYDNGTY